MKRLWVLNIAGGLAALLLIGSVSTNIVSHFPGDRRADQAREVMARAPP